MQDKSTRYSEQFRQQMVELVRSGRKYQDLALEFGCHASSIRYWVQRDGGAIPASSGSAAISANEREELVRLRRENKRLMVERDILSKATAWFAGNGAPMSTASTR